MALGTFNVSEFNTIYSMLEEHSNKISSKSNDIIRTCEQLSQLIKSEDSGLSSAYIRIGDTLGIAKNKIVSLLSQLENEMKSYASRTIANEQETSKGIEKLNADIEGIASILNEIASKNG